MAGAGTPKSSGLAARGVNVPLMPDHPPKLDEPADTLTDPGELAGWRAGGQAGARGPWSGPPRSPNRLA
jgi:hypothetical protein